MKNNDVFEKFSAELLDCGVENRSFREICESIGERTSVVNSSILGSVGVSGETLTESLRLGIPLPLMITPGFASLLR